jgi:hypothetical protein
MVDAALVFFRLASLRVAPALRRRFVQLAVLFSDNHLPVIIMLEMYVLP